MHPSPLSAGKPTRPAQDLETPSDLLSQFTALSLSAVLAILLLAGYTIHGVVDNEMVQIAESTSIHVGNSIFAQERATLLEEHGRGARMRIDPSEFPAFDLRMRRYLRSFDMYMIKAFDAEGWIIYSTDSGLIGQSERGNARLEQALASGRVVSSVNHLDSVTGFDDVIRRDIEMVEAYVPVSIGDATVGAFEVYVDATSTRNRAAAAMKWILVKLTLVLFGVFTLLYLLMRKGMVRLSRAERKQRELATRDMLTGLFNRHHLLHHIHSERDRMSRVGRGDKTGMALLMIDIDRFKAVNDTHGHLTGDKVLREVAARLKRQLRPYDNIGRYGGEEFLALLPNTDLPDSMLVAERLRRAISGDPVVCGDLSLQVSVSIGAAASLRPDEPIEEIIHRADLGMYHAKRTGRDRALSVDHGSATAAIAGAVA